METKAITQVIEQKLDKEGVLIDDVLITEMEKHRVGNNTYFDVRKLHGGLYKSLGMWKINIYTGEILGIAPSGNSLDKLLSFEEYKPSLKKLKVEEELIRESSNTPKKILERFSAEKVDSLFKLLNPKNYIRIHLNSIVQKAIKPRNRLEFSDEALHLHKNEGAEISEKLGFGSPGEITKTILDLAEYSAFSNNRDKITGEDVQNASSFAKAILGLAIEFFSDEKDPYFRNDRPRGQSARPLQRFCCMTPI